ncbi:hypothetical protein TorRG33x02_292780 [Trema orientale]|uniref:Uncharacterized protein n=1 Tax=Trema orientale TaxID=63057 RepID=A0A2P5CA04_TREOI|nr:hypothetical protein TorRG33x02_292780 [Trema orientale]
MDERGRKRKRGGVSEGVKGERYRETRDGEEE